MERDAHTAKSTEPNPDRIIWIMPWPGLAERLARALSAALREFVGGPVSYLRAAFLPERIEDWFPIKFAKLVGASLAHPVDTSRGALATEPIGADRRRPFLRILATLAVVYFGLGLYVAYLAFFSQFAHMRVVDNKDYKKFDPDTLLSKLYYPPQMLRGAPRGPAMTLEEIRARAEKHKKELALAREKAEKEKKEKEEADRKAAEEAAKVAAAAAAQNKPAAPPTAIGEINIAPIRDIVGNLYKLFEAGGLDIPEVKFSMMAGFRVMPDGSFQDIRIMPNGSSGSKIIDRNALEILSNLGESHALGQVSQLTSTTISLDITEDIARIRIVAFAPTPEIAKEKAGLLNALFWALGLKERGTELGQLLKLITVKTEGKRVDTNLIVPKAQAAQMFRAWSANPGSTPPQ